MKVIKLKTSFEDDRGQITDLLEDEEINSISLITFKKGVVRGNHYHEKTFQWNYLLSGKIKLVTQMPNGKRVEIIMNKGDLSVTVPMEKHVLEALETSELMVFTKGPRSGRAYETDTFRLETPLVSPK